MRMANRVSSSSKLLAMCVQGLKVIPSGYSSATWCYMATGCLSTSVQKEWCVGFHYKNDNESQTFQWRKPLILQYNVDTDVSLAYL